MRKIVKKLSAMALCTVFASTQIAAAAIDTGLNNAQINTTQGGYVGMDKGVNSATLKFDGNSHVNWNTLNVGKGETLNFNAVNNAKGLTVVNTVNNGMTEVYGAITSNDGIAKLIISNPNGLLFDGASFTTAGDLELTTQPLDVKLLNGSIQYTALDGAEAKNGVVIKNIKAGDFNIGGEFNIYAPTIEITDSNIIGGLKLVTKNGQDYLVCKGADGVTKHVAVKMEAVSVDGNVYIVSGKDIVEFVNGGTVDGNLTIVSDGNVSLNSGMKVNDKGNLVFDYDANTPRLNVTGNIKSDSDGRVAYLRSANVGGNVEMSNSGGFLEVANVNVGGNVDLKTTVATNAGVKHFVHVVGDNDIKGNLNVDSAHNIHIGGYNEDLDELAKGGLKVGGNINANAREGSIAVTVDTSANKVALTSGTLNIISDGKATIKANEYELKAEGYIGGLDTQDKLISTMENYTLIPPAVKTFLNIEGGKVSKLETGNKGYAFVRANGNMDVDGVKANVVNLSSGKDIKIGPNASAKLIKVEGETRNLTVELPSRDYELQYYNIKDTELIKVNPNTEITYEMANGEKGWNKGTQTAANTYLVVPGTPVQPEPPVKPNNNLTDDNENVKILRNLERNPIASAIDAQEVYTPVAFAADLDDEVDTGVRKNVDGSVTVVRAFTPSN